MISSSPPPPSPVHLARRWRGRIRFPRPLVFQIQLLLLSHPPAPRMAPRLSIFHLPTVSAPRAHATFTKKKNPGSIGGGGGTPLLLTGASHGAAADRRRGGRVVVRRRPLRRDGRSAFAPDERAPRPRQRRPSLPPPQACAAALQSHKLPRPRDDWELSWKILPDWDDAPSDVRQAYKQFLGAMVKLLNGEVVSEEL